MYYNFKSTKCVLSTSIIVHVQILHTQFACICYSKNDGWLGLSMPVPICLLKPKQLNFSRRFGLTNFFQDSLFSHWTHASLERSLRENLTAKTFFNGFFLIVFLNFWNVKWQNSTIAAFLKKEYVIEINC